MEKGIDGTQESFEISSEETPSSEEYGSSDESSGSADSIIFNTQAKSTHSVDFSRMDSKGKKKYLDECYDEFQSAIKDIEIKSLSEGYKKKPLLRCGAIPSAEKDAKGLRQSGIPQLGSKMKKRVAKAMRKEDEDKLVIPPYKQKLEKITDKNFTNMQTLVM